MFVWWAHSCGALSESFGMCEGCETVVQVRGDSSVLRLYTVQYSMQEQLTDEFLRLCLVKSHFAY